MADFGLTRDIYAAEYYVSDKHTRLPVKWMSPESLLDNYFNEKTDVVCYMFKGSYVHPHHKIQVIKWSQL